MADITMCDGRNCDKKETCYRFTAVANTFRQAVFTETPWVEHKGEQICTHFWLNQNTDTKKGEP